MRFRLRFVATHPVQQQQISGQNPSSTWREYRSLPQLCQALGRWSGGFFRRCRVLRNSMETREFPDHGLKRCGSILKRPFRSPSGKRRQCPQSGRVRNAVEARSGCPGGVSPGETACPLVAEVPAVGAGRRLRHEEAACLPAFRFGRLRGSDCLAASHPLGRSSASKTVERFGRGLRKVREHENVLRRISACLPNDSPDCGRTRRKGAVGLDGLDVSCGTPADEGAVR